MRLDSHRDASGNPSEAEVAENPLPRNSLVEIQEDGATTTADGSRKKADFALYKYYLENAGYAAVLCYAAAVVVWISCIEFSRKSSSLPSNRDSTRLTPSQAIWMKWWSKANTIQANRDIGFYMGIYALLGVLGTIGAASAACEHCNPNVI